MSDFKVGDKVKCVRDDRASKLISGKIYTITSVVTGITPTGGSSVCVDGIEDGWWYADRFELIQPPQPAESPDDWVEITDPNHVPRVGIDWFEGPGQVWEVQASHHGGFTVGQFAEMSGGNKHRCRRRDYPQKPVEAHAGGPYVARSEYERVCLERDKLKADQESLLADLKDAEQTVIHLNKRVFVDNPNGWPLVPVDPACIPERHRAVEVTTQIRGKFIACPNRTVFMHSAGQDYPRLVVEPIPTPVPDALPRPEFPAWIRAGWWVAMDLNKDWYAYESKPAAYEASHGGDMECLDLTEHLTHSMQAIPCSRWREAKWRIE